MKQKKPFWPFLILGLFFSVLFNRAVALYEMAPPPTAGHLFSNYEYVFKQYTEAPITVFTVTSVALGISALGLLIGLFLYSYGRPEGTYRNGEESGSARFATAQEIKGFRNKDEHYNMIFTKNAQMGLYNKHLPYEWQLNKNVLVIGLPGDGKTFTFVKPNIMQMNSSYVVTDPKGLLVHEVGKMLEANGYNVKIFDLVNLTNSDTFNPFHYMKSELDIDRISEAIIDGTKKSDNQGENFWVQANLLLTRALIGYLYFDSQVRNYTPNLAMVSDLLRDLQRTNEDEPSPVEKLFEQLEKKLPNNYANRQWNLFNANFQAETRTSVLAVMSAQYSVFDHEQVTNMIQSDSMEMDTWNTQPTAVFIAIPETNKAFNFLASTMFAVMFDVLTHSADDILQGRRTGYDANDLIHVQMIIDEFANIGKIPNFNEVLASVRSREMSIKIILQATNQLQALYKNDWKTIFNNCATHLFLGTNDEDTMKYYSMRAGKQTIKQTNYSETRGRTRSGSTSYQNSQRDLMTPDEIARIGVDEALVYISKQPVFRDKKASVLDHKMKDLLSDGPNDNNWYDYTRHMSDIEEFLSSIDTNKIEKVSEEDYQNFEELWEAAKIEAEKEDLQATTEEAGDDLFAYVDENASESFSQESNSPIKTINLETGEIL